ncbi:MAG: signal peptidase II [Acidimicrobiia bacterium]
MSRRAFAVVVASAVVGLDQLTKWWATTALADGPIVVVDGFFQLKLTFNTGASFSLFSGSGEIVALIVIGVVGLIFYVLKDASRRIEAAALGLVLGGAVGNLIDRVLRGDGLLDGAVVDFIDFSFFATFNVADIAVNVGVVLLFIAAFWKRQ